MSALMQDQSRPKFLANLDELTRALDDLAAPSVPTGSRVVPIAEERLAFNPAAPPSRQRYQFTSWAKRWRDGPPALPLGKRTPLERWPLVFGLGGLLWLAMTGVMVAGWQMSQPSYADASLLPPGVEEVQGEIGAALDPAEELAAAVEDLQAGPVQNIPGGRAPRILSPVAVSQGQTECLGTSVKFVEGPAEAALQAKSNRKLMMLLNVSGDFDDTRFT